MLVLTRCVNEGVVITVPASDQPQTIALRVIDTYSRKVRLGFDAHRNIEIYREELLQGGREPGSEPSAGHDVYDALDRPLAPVS